VILGLALLATLVFYSPMYRVKAPFEFANIEKRVISAPVDAELLEVLKRPGDEVKQGEVLARLRGDEIRQELIRAQQRAAVAAKERDTLLHAVDQSGQPRTAEAMMKDEERKTAEADIKLYSLQLEQLEIKSPISGRVMQGDLRDRIGSMIKQSEQLFEVAPASFENRVNLRVQVALPERDIQRIGVNRSGEIRTSSRPDLTWPIVVERIVPTTTESKNGGNAFTVYANIAWDKIEAADQKALAADWLPRQAGEAAIDFEHRPLIWHWTHRLVEWVRVKLWW
jgi:multidrug resistance efflux pump